MQIRSHGRTLAAVVAIVGLTLTLAACSVGEESSAGSSTTTGGSNTEAPTETDADTNADDLAPLGHEAALAAGFDQQLAITCGYTYDEEEMAGLKAMNPAAGSTPEATIYLDRGAVYWDIPQPDGKMSHMLALDGFLYTWKLPGDSTGVKSPDTTNGGGDELKQRLTKNAHDCKAYTGPSSIFQPPADITFQDIG